MSLTYDSYTNRVSASTASYLNSVYHGLNRTTNGLLASMGVLRPRATPTVASIDDLVDRDIVDINSAVDTATDTIGRNQAADAAIATIYDTLGTMRDLVQDVAIGTLSEAQVAAKDSEYRALGAEITALLAETTYQAAPVLSGSDAVAALDLADITGMSLTALPDDALGDMATAMTDVGLARSDLAGETAELTATVAGLETQATALARLSAQVTTAREALGVLRSTTALIMTQITASLAAQGAYLSSQIDNLVGVNFIG